MPKGCFNNHLFWHTYYFVENFLCFFEVFEANDHIMMFNSEEVCTMAHGEWLQQLCVQLMRGNPFRNIVRLSPSKMIMREKFFTREANVPDTSSGRNGVRYLCCTFNIEV